MAYFLRYLVFFISLLPLIWFVLSAASTGLGANPVENIQRYTGDWTLNLLLVTLTIAPLQKFASWKWTGGIHRITGLFALFYGALHFTNYVALDQFFSWEAIIEDITKHKRIIVGFAAFILIIQQAATSLRPLRKYLHIKQWRALHRFIYIAAISGVIHYLWLVKKDVFTPLIYATILAVIFMYRISLWIVRKRS